MKIRSIIVFAVVLSAAALFFSSNFLEMKTVVQAEGLAKCAIPALSSAVSQAGAVFTGEVIRDEKNGDVRTIVFKTEKYWKGKVGKEITVYVYETPRFESWFKKGERYLIFAVPDENGKLRINRCSRSNEIGDAGEDLKKLGKGKKPRK